jgi:SAM-dependent methyltransferase
LTSVIDVFENALVNAITQWVDRTAYPHHSDRWDAILLREKVLSHIRPGMRVLDFGAGAGHCQEMNFRGLAHISGCDVEESVERNPYLDEGRRSTDTIPWPDNEFDLVISKDVVEHLDDPITIFEEIYRVLKPDGRLIIKTPNTLHYVTILSRLLPFSLHQTYGRLRGDDVEDMFPTRYRCNSRKAIRRLALRTGFSLESLDLIEGRPEYLRIFLPAYLLGLAYERIVNATKLLESFRVVLIGTLRKP